MSWCLSLISGLPMRAWLAIAAIIAFAAWSGTLYSAGYARADAMWRARNLEAQLAEIEAKLGANDEIRKTAEAEAEKAEADAQRLKVLLDELQKAQRSCALTPQHVDGVRRIDESP